MIEQQQESQFISPLLFLGVFIFAAPVIMNIMQIHMPSWISGMGIFIIFLGAGHTIWARVVN